MGSIQQALRHFWATLQSGGQVAPLPLWAYGLLTLMVAAEGPIVMLVSSGAATTGMLNPALVLISAILGNTLSDAAWYTLGRNAHLDWLLKRRKRIGIEPTKLERLKSAINERVGSLLFFAKVTNGMIVPVIIATGYARVPLRRWLPAVALSNGIIAVVFVSVGYYGTAHLLRLQQGLQHLAVAGTLAFVLLTLLCAPRWLRRACPIAQLPPAELGDEEEVTCES